MRGKLLDYLLRPCFRLSEISGNHKVRDMTYTGPRMNRTLSEMKLQQRSYSIPITILKVIKGTQS